MAASTRITIATAGWTVTREAAPRFPDEGTHLARYARVLGGVEINSSFYRSHAPATYRKWADATPGGFRFAVKLPGLITHELGLRGARGALQSFYEEIAGLGRKRGPVLVQLPKSHVFERRVTDRFLGRLRSLDAGPVVVEPRHASWFAAAADRVLMNHHVARAAADPICCPGAGLPGGWPRLVYYRLHGTPRMYWSRYAPEYIAALAADLDAHARTGAQVWCVFDNTAWGGAILNALELEGVLTGKHPGPRARAPGPG
jgi:uncharacterized protein YecE (DUF72 family)